MLGSVPPVQYLNNIGAIGHGTLYTSIGRSKRKFWNDSKSKSFKYYNYNYLCTYDLYSPLHNVLDACISITRGSGRELGPGILEFFGPITVPWFLNQFVEFPRRSIIGCFLSKAGFTIWDQLFMITVSVSHKSIPLTVTLAVQLCRIMAQLIDLYSL